MGIDIRQSIIDNFQNDKRDVIEGAIIESIENSEEITLPGMGVFFEILWTNATDKMKTSILDILEEKLKK